MLRSLKSLERYQVSATDGDLGTVANFLLDDERWVVRYLVVETGSFFSERLVLISPISFRRVDWSTHRFELALTMDKIRHSPSIDTDRPVSREHERNYHAYYGYPHYWGFAGTWAMGSHPGVLAGARGNEVPIREVEARADVHLRAAKEVCGYHIQGTDGAIGHVDDFIVDEETWEIRYLVVATSHWWFGKKILLSPHWANRVSWGNRKVFIDLSREAIKSGPEWNPEGAVNREYEVRLYDYYGRRAYWEGTTALPPTHHAGDGPA